MPPQRPRSQAVPESPPFRSLTLTCVAQGSRPSHSQAEGSRWEQGPRFWAPRSWDLLLGWGRPAGSLEAALPGRGSHTSRHRPSSGPHGTEATTAVNTGPSSGVGHTCHGGNPWWGGGRCLWEMGTGSSPSVQREAEPTSSSSCRNGKHDALEDASAGLRRGLAP